jgi:hypothetical protein
MCNSESEDVERCSAQTAAWSQCVCLADCAGNAGEWASHTKVPLPSIYALLTSASCCRHGAVRTSAHKSLGSVQGSNSTFLFSFKSVAGSHGCEAGREYLQFCQGAWNPSQDSAQLDGAVEYQELIPNARTTERLPIQPERGQENKANSGAVRICNTAARCSCVQLYCVV